MSNRHPDDTTSRRLHVLHVSAPGEGGVATVALGLRPRPGRARVERLGGHVVARLPGVRRPRARRADVTGGRRSASPGRRVVGEAIRLARIIREADPDVVHLHSSKAGLVGRLAMRNRRPTVFQPHAWSYLAATGGVRAASLRWERFADPLDRADRLRERRRADRRAQRLGIGGRTVVVRNGVALSTFRPQGNRDRTGRAQAARAWPTRRRPSAWASSTAQKGQRDLLRGLAGRARAGAGGPAGRSSATDPTAATCAAARPGPARRHAWWARAATSAPGWRPPTSSSCPRGWDGMSLVPLEAMASARSVVATSVSGVAESVPDDAGAIVAAGRPGGHGDRGRRAACCDPDRAHDEGWAGRAHVEAHHDMHAVRARAGAGLPAAGGGAPVALADDLGAERGCYRSSRGVI